MKSSIRPAVLAAIALSLGQAAHAASPVAITEWMYNGVEFIELTNLGNTAVDMTGWSFDDESNTPGSTSLSAFGLVAAGESVILAEDEVSDFRNFWNLAASVKVIGGNTHNLGRNDQIYIYDASGAVVDSLRFGDSSYVPGSIRAQDISGNPRNLAALNDATSINWVLSSAGDAFGSINSTVGTFVANPGVFALAPAVPEPTSVALLLAGVAVVGAAARRRA